MRRHRRTTKIIAVAAVLTMFGLVACSASDNGGVVGGAVAPSGKLAPSGQMHGLLPSKILAAGVLTVGTELGRAPLMFYGNGTTQPEGIEYELLQAMARQLGVTIQIVDLPLEKLSSELLAGKIDVLMSGFIDLKALENTGVSFVDYLTGRTSVLVQDGDPSRVGGPDDLCGRLVGVLVGTAQQITASQIDAACSARHLPPLRLKGAATHVALLALLTSAQVQADLDDSIVAAYSAQVSIGAGTVEVVGAAVDPVPYGIGINKADTQLVTAIQAALRAIITDGEYDEALSRWGGSEAALRTAGINQGI